ncbi:MAG: metallophosphoesterase [Gemmatimonadaceae bacterium]
MILHAVAIAPRQLRVTDVDAPISGLPAEFDGYTIGILSDLHQAALPGPSHTRRAMEAVMRARPDLIALLGDFGVSFKVAPALSRAFYQPGMRTLAPMIRSLSAPDGVVAVLGNHDYYYDAAAVRQWLASLGVRVMVNECRLLERGGARLALGAVDDAKEGSVDPLAGCGGVPPEVPRIVLSHNPDGMLHVTPEARVGLMLSGHTHGGQVILPFIGALVRNSKICGPRHPRGWVPDSPAPLFVSAGVGSQIPFRFRCEPDVVIVRLRLSTPAHSSTAASTGLRARAR